MMFFEIMDITSNEITQIKYDPNSLEDLETAMITASEKMIVMNFPPDDVITSIRGASGKPPGTVGLWIQIAYRNKIDDLIAKFKASTPKHEHREFMLQKVRDMEFAIRNTEMYTVLMQSACNRGMDVGEIDRINKMLDQMRETVAHIKTLVPEE